MPTSPPQPTTTHEEYYTTPPERRGSKPLPISPRSSISISKEVPSPPDEFNPVPIPEINAGPELDPSLYKPASRIPTDELEVLETEKPPNEPLRRGSIFASEKMDREASARQRRLDDFLHRHMQPRGGVDYVGQSLLDEVLARKRGVHVRDVAGTTAVEGKASVQGNRNVGRERGEEAGGFAAVPENAEDL